MPRRPKIKIISNDHTKAFDWLFGAGRGLHYREGNWERFQHFKLMTFRRMKE
jgi:hypothetical protein